MEIISKSEAKALGRTRYFTGKPCKYGHVAERYTKSYYCVQCSIEIRRAWRERNHDKWLKQHNTHRKNNIESYRAASRRSYNKNKHKYLKYQENKLVEMAGRAKPDKCDICGRDGRICFDHSHQFGHFRGWLCVKCNTVLGLVEDSPAMLLSLCSYLIQDEVKNKAKQGNG